MADRPAVSPDFLIQTEATKAAFDKGFRISRGKTDGWLVFASASAHGLVFISASADREDWYLALDHPGVVAEIGLLKAELAGPGLARYRFSTLTELYKAIEATWRLGQSLPEAPLERFEAETGQLPRSTEAERLAVQRVGQNIFRDALLAYWEGRCPLTGISEPALLRASHIVPWAECASDAQRLDVHNGLLLSSLWDAAFDAGLISFADDGRVLISARLDNAARIALRVEEARPLSGLTAQHLPNLDWHWTRHGYEIDV